MRRVIGALIFSGVATAVWAQQSEIETVIENQMQAFQREDVATAFSYAAPNIQSMFGTAQNFGLMVENGYPMVWDNVDTRFVDLSERADGHYQRVLVQDESGAFYYFEYQMIEIEGAWRISGVQPLPAPDVGA